MATEQRFWQGMDKATVIGLLDKILVGMNTDGSAKYADINQIVGLIEATGSDGFKGPAIASTNPGTPTKPQYYSATPGVTYTYFLDSTGTPISIPLKVGANYVINAKLVYSGNWQAIYDAITIDLTDYVSKASSPTAYYGTYTSTAAAIASVVSANRKLGTTVGVIVNGKTKEYWWRDNITDAGLVTKSDIDLIKFNQLVSDERTIPQPTSALTFSSISGIAAGFNTTTGVMTPTGSGTYATALSDVDLRAAKFEKSSASWVGIGKTSTLAIMLNVDTGQTIGINSSGANAANLGVFASGSIPSGALNYIVDVSGAYVIVTYTLNGSTYIEWGRKLKSAITGYASPRLGTMTFGVTKMLSWTLIDLKETNDAKFDLTTIEEKPLETDDTVMILSPSSPSKARKVKPSALFDGITKDLVFRAAVNVDYTFLPIPTGAVVTNNNGLVAVGGGGGTYSVALASVPLDELVQDNKEWIAIGKGSDYGIILQTTSGQLKRVSSTGTLVNQPITGTGFPTTALPNTSTKIKIQLSYGNIIVSYSVNGVDFTEWGRVGVSQLTDYVSSNFGVTSISASNVSGIKTTAKNGEDKNYKVFQDNILEKVSAPEDFVFLLNKNEVSGVKKMKTADFLASVGITPSPYLNKIGVVYGDSITDEYNVAAGTYTNRIKNKLGLSVVNKFGYIGRTIGAGASGSFMGTGQWDAILATSPDVLFLLGGTNDFGGTGGTDIGLMTSTNMNETVGALRAFIKYMKAARPAMDLIICTPLPRANQNTPNAKGFILKDYVDAIINVGQQYSVPVVDLFRNSGIAFDVTQSTALYLPDLLHPNAAGYEKFTALQCNFAKSLK